MATESREREAAGTRAGDLLAAGAAATLSFVLYLSTLGSTPFWQDAGLFLAGVARGGGLAPPGYPVWLVPACLFAASYRSLWPAHSLARAVHTLDAAWAALAAGLVALAVLRLTAPGYRFFWRGAGPDGPPPRPPRRGRPKAAPPTPVPGNAAVPGVAPSPWTRRLAAALAGAMAGVSYSLWSQAVNAEAYALHGFFVVLVLLLVLRLAAMGPLGAAPGNGQRRGLLLLALAFGLSCGNHPATVVLVPPLAWLAWRERAALADRRCVLGVLAVLFLAGGVPYAYLPYAAARHAATLYDDVRGLRPLLWHVLGVQWTASGESYGWSWDRLLDLPRMAWLELFAAGWAGAAAGAWLVWKRDRTLAAFLAILLGIATAVPVLYLQGGEYDMWLIPTWLVVAVLAGVGFDHALTLAHRRGTGMALGATALLAVAALAPPVAVNRPLLDRRQDTMALDFGLNLFRPVAPGAVLYAWSDQECSLTWYLQSVEDHRPDVTVVAAPLLTMGWYRAWLGTWKRDIALPRWEAEAKTGAPAEDLVLRLVQANPNRAHYTSKRPARSVPPVEWVPAGTLWKWDPKRPGTIDPRDWDYVYRDPDPFGRPARHHAPLRATDAQGRPTVIRTPYSHQIRLFHEQAWKNLGDWHAARGEWPAARDAFARVLGLDPGIENVAVLFGYGKALFAVGDDGEAERQLAKVARLSPVHAEAHLYLGQLAARRGDRAVAEAEFAAVRRLSPDLWRAQEASLRAGGFVP